MPFDPTLPAEDADIVSAELRAQFNGLKTLLDALPAEVQTTMRADSAANCNRVDPLDFALGDPPTQADLRTVVNKLNELITALRR